MTETTVTLKVVSGFGNQKKNDEISEAFMKHMSRVYPPRWKGNMTDILDWTQSTQLFKKQPKTIITHIW